MKRLLKRTLILLAVGLTVSLIALLWRSPATATLAVAPPLVQSTTTTGCQTFTATRVSVAEDNLPDMKFTFPTTPGARVTSGGALEFSRPNSTVQAISCTDDFWDFQIDIWREGETVGDQMKLFVRRTDGTVIATIASFKVIRNSGGHRVVQVASLHPEVTLYKAGVRIRVGENLPFTALSGDRRHTGSLALVINMSFAGFGCAQAGIEIKRGGETGLSSFLMEAVEVKRGTGNTCREVCPSCQTCDVAFIVIDEDSIDNDDDLDQFSASDVNDDVAEIGVRAQLRYFRDNVGQTLRLHTGEVGDEGWFALKTIPGNWQGGLRGLLGNVNASPESAPPHGVSPGLGAPLNGDREALLDKIPNVTPFRATGLRNIVGKTVCAIVWDSDISMNYGPLNGQLKGANNGTVAFEVLSATPLFGFSSGSLPEMRVRILDARKVCTCQNLRPFTNVPEPRSSSEPYDTGR